MKFHYMLLHPNTYRALTRKTKSLFSWLGKVCGLSQLWLEGISADGQLLWGWIKSLGAERFGQSYWMRAGLLSATVLGAVTLLPAPSLQAQSSLDLGSIIGTSAAVANGEAVSDYSGYAVSSGDLNGDGVDDVIISAPLADPNGSESGKTYVVFGKTEGFSATVELSSLDGTSGFVLNGEAVSDRSGHVVSSGDLNGDGVDDVIIGAPYADPNGGESGKTYVFFNQATGQITGTEGFRMLSAPVSGAVFDDLLGDFWTQGFTGADATDGSSNVFVWDASLNTNATAPNTGDWTPLSNHASDNLAAGQGFLLFAFSDDNGPAVAGDAGFPKTIAKAPFFGSAGVNAGTVNPISTLGDGRFFLAGNPYAQTIDWDSLGKSGLSNAVQVWDNAATAWKNWNGTVGNLTDGLIAPFQGFFIEGSGGNGSLSIEEADMSGTPATLLKAPQTESALPVLSLEMSAGAFTSTAFLQFDPRAKNGLDALDARALAPLSSSYAHVFTQDDEGNVLSINALLGDRGYELPLHLVHKVDGAAQTGSVQLRWKGLDSFASDWQLELVNVATGAVIDLRATEQAELDVPEGQGQPSETVGNKAPSLVAQATSEAGYLLRVTPGTITDAEDVSVKPERVALEQNFPNPFNPSTTIRFALDRPGNVAISVFDLMGRRVASLVNGQRPAGEFAVQFDASNLASGIYLYRLEVNGVGVAQRKLTLIK